jgi:NADH dehydrogenase FAD-containing subunit
MQAKMRRILILGGGCGGIYVAMHLDRMLGRVNPIRKLLRHVQFFEGDVEAVDLDARQVTVSHGSDRHTHDGLRPSGGRARFRHNFFGTLHFAGIFRRGRPVCLPFPKDEHVGLLLPPGKMERKNFFGMAGLEANALTMKTLGDAIHLRNRIIKLFSKDIVQFLTLRSTSISHAEEVLHAKEPIRS